MDLAQRYRYSIPAGTAKYGIFAEDDPDIAFMLRMILAQAGFDADTARTVDRPRNLIKEIPYVVTLDLALPDEQGRVYDPTVSGWSESYGDVVNYPSSSSRPLPKRLRYINSWKNR